MPYLLKITSRHFRKFKRTAIEIRNWIKIDSSSQSVHRPLVDLALLGVGVVIGVAETPSLVVFRLLLVLEIRRKDPLRLLRAVVRGLVVHNTWCSLADSLRRTVALLVGHCKRLQIKNLGLVFH
jgi:hypothetical protein